MTFTFVTLFENTIKCYFEDSILKRAIQNEILKINFINPRDFTLDKHKKVDEYLIGGGAGLLLKTQPLFDALKSIKERSKNTHIIFASPAGKPFKQKDAIRLSKKEHIVFVAGRYEGFDERIIELCADEVFSIGDFILTGGEIACLCMCDSISRQVDGVLGNKSSLKEESFEEDLLEAPNFTKPNIFLQNSVIKEFLKGNHAKIHRLKKNLSLLKTKYFRPDLYKKAKSTIRTKDEK